MRARLLFKAASGRFEGLVSPRVECPQERGRQAGAIAILVTVGLAAAAASPVAVISGSGLHGIVAPTLIAGLMLAAAGILAATARLDLIIGILLIAAAAALGGLAALGGGLASPLLWGLCILPAETLILRRPRLFRLGLGAALAALAAVALLDLADRAGQMLDPASLTPWVVGGMALYASALVGRLVAVRADAEAAAVRSAGTLPMEDLLEAAILRFEANGRLVHASRAALALFGVEDGPLTADRLFDRIHVADRVRFLKAFGELRGGAGTVDLTIQLRDPAAGAPSWRSRHLRLLAEVGESGRILAIIDGTTIAAAKVPVLETALAAAEQASEAKSRFLASVSHELRTPLNAIIGFSDILDQEFFGSFEDPRQKEYVGLIRQSGEHLLSVVNGLLDMSKIEAGRYELHPEPFRMAELMETVCGMMRQQAVEKGLGLEFRPRCEAAEIVADKRACQQILLNLVANAIKFTDSGRITVETRVAAEELVLTVSDTGIGIAEGEISRLGQPFTQLSSGLSRQYQGTGLGLSLVKGLTELHGGSMEISSALGVGTRVMVRMPLDCSKTAEETANLKENVVALNDARKKNQHNPRNAEARRTA